jgi:rhomboid protease GluP
MQGQSSFGRRGATLAAPASPVRAAPARAFLAPDSFAPDSSAPNSFAFANDFAAADAAADEDTPFSRAPFATIIILVFLAGLFLLQMTDQPMAKPGVIALKSLIHLGAVSRDFIFKDGQVWRLLTAGWLHASASHFIGNAIALVMVGLLLEPIIGWRWFAAVYTLGGIGGALGSILLNEKSIVSVGASGAIMAVMACAGAISLHPASEGRRMYIWRLCAFAGVPALMPTSSSSHVDYSAHMGGAIVGVLIGFALISAWDHARRRPPLEGRVATTGAVIGFLGVCAVATAAVLPPAKLHHMAVTPGLVPPDQWPTPATEAEAQQQANELYASYPDDPRVLHMQAAGASQRGAFSEAERDLQTALASPLLHAPEIRAGEEQRMRILLIGVQLKQNEIDAARQSARPLCPVQASLEARLQEGLKALKACD